MSLSIIIPNYNGKEILSKNLPKVIKSAKGSEIIVVDDASSDDSVDMLKRDFPSVKVIEKPKNDGFAGTVNIGVRASSSDLVLILNSDVEPMEDFINPLIPHFKDPNIFAVGSLQEITDKNKEKTIQGVSTGKFQNGFLIHGPSNPKESNTLWVFGGAGMYKKEIWDRLGGLDGIYSPFYWEDIDLSYRALKSGFKILFEPKSIVKHTQYEGSIRKNYSEFSINSISYRNQILFVWLNITDKDYLFDHFLSLPLHIFKSMLNFNFAFLFGLWQAIQKIPTVLKKRKIHKKTFNRQDREVLASFN